MYHRSSYLYTSRHRRKRAVGETRDIGLATTTVSLSTTTAARATVCLTSQRQTKIKEFLMT